MGLSPAAKFVDVVFFERAARRRITNVRRVDRNVQSYLKPSEILMRAGSYLSLLLYRWPVISSLYRVRIAVTARCRRDFFTILRGALTHYHRTLIRALIFAQINKMTGLSIFDIIVNHTFLMRQVKLRFVNPDTRFPLYGTILRCSEFCIKI